MERDALALIGAANRHGLGLHCLKNPAGTWSFVGSVPMSLRYAMRDGSPVSDDLAQKIANHGVGLFRKDVQTLCWDTRDAAVADATAQGFTVHAD